MIYAYLSSAASAVAAIAAVFFLRYWRDSRDRFFVIWAIAFGLLAAQWAVSAFSGSDAYAGVYLLRLGGFLLILAAIIDKNRGGAGRRRARVGPAASADDPGSAERPEPFAPSSSR